MPEILDSLSKKTVQISADSLRKLNLIAEKYLAEHKNVQWEDYFTLLLLIVISGIIGGVINYFNKAETDEIPIKKALIKSISLGIGAAIIVPVFFQITQSKILEEVIQGDVFNMLLLTSFCVLAGVASSKFIATVSDSVLTRLEKVEKSSQTNDQKTSVLIKATEQRGGTKTLPQITKKTLGILENFEIENNDDPNKGSFGGVSKLDGYEILLSKYTKIDEIDGWIELTFKVVSNDNSKPLGKKVKFFLHPTFKPDEVEVEVKNGMAVLTRIAWGAFTVGAEMEDGTRLEYDLAEDLTLPEEFRKR